jgi:hypothetical protein
MLPQVFERGTSFEGVLRHNAQSVSSRLSRIRLAARAIVEISFFTLSFGVVPFRSISIRLSDAENPYPDALSELSNCNRDRHRCLTLSAEHEEETTSFKPVVETSDSPTPALHLSAVLGH